MEDAYLLVDTVEKKMMSIANVLRGLDKRMSYNLRLIGSVTIQDENIPEKTNKDLADLLIVCNNHYYQNLQKQKKLSLD